MMDEEIRAALGQDNLAFIKFEHLKNVNLIIKRIQGKKIWELSFRYWDSVRDLEYLQKHRPRFDILYRQFWKKDVERAKEEIADIERDIHALGYKSKEIFVKYDGS